MYLGTGRHTTQVIKMVKPIYAAAKKCEDGTYKVWCTEYGIPIYETPKSTTENSRIFEKNGTLTEFVALDISDLLQGKFIPEEYTFHPISRGPSH